MIRRPPRSPLFPHTPLSRPDAAVAGRRAPPVTGAGRDVAVAAGSVGDRRPAVGAEGDGGRGDERATVDRQAAAGAALRSEEHTSELQSRQYLVCRLLLEKKK